MKKAIFVILALIGFTAVSSAQSKSIGVRIGNYVDVSYELNVLSDDFLEFDGGIATYQDPNFHVDGIYNIMISQPQWTSEGTWGFYAGPGASVSAWAGSEGKSAVYAGVLGNVGLEYTFNIPLQLSIDARPRLMFGNGGVWTEGILSFGVSVRYAF